MPAAAFAPGDADTVTVVAALDARFRVAVTVDTPPFSGIDAGFSESVTPGAASSSVIVNVTSEGCVTPTELDAEPDTVTLLSGESVVSFTAVTVTVPALVVAPDAIVSVLFALSVKAVPAPGDAETVIVVATLDARFRVAVTVVAFGVPLSPIVADDNASVARGGPSSSRIVSVLPVGFPTPLPPEAVPETATDLFGSSSLLSTAVIVTAPVLVVSPDAIVNLSVLDNVKSPAAVSAPGAADTVTVTAALDTPESVAVTVAAFDVPLSSIVADDNASVTVGNASSSVSVSVALDGAATPLPPEAVPETVTDLSGESTEFPTAVTVTVPMLVVSPDAIVNLSALDNVKSAATAPVPAAAATVTVTAALDVLSSVAVTVDTPLLSEIDDGDSASATVGNPSSSVSVSDAPVTLPAPCVLATVAVTVVERPPLPWCVSSSTAAIVAVSDAFAVSPAAIVIVESEPTV